MNADDGRLGNGRVADCGVLKVNGADPFASGLDDIFRAVGDLHVAIGVDVGDIAGGKPVLSGSIFAQRIAAFALEIAVADPGTAYQQVAEGFSVPGQILARVVHDFHIDPENRATLLALDGQPLLR